MTLKPVTAPAALPLDWESEVKGHLRLDADDERGRVETVAIAAAKEWAENYTGRALITQTWKVFLDRFPGQACPFPSTHHVARWPDGRRAALHIEIPKPPLQSITHIKYLDGDGVQQTWSPTLYEVDPPAGAPFDPFCQAYRVRPKAGQGWPIALARPASVEIQFVCGYGDDAADVPAKLRAAMLVMVAEQFERREMVVVGNIVNAAPLNAKYLANDFRVRLVHEEYS